jgi:hypothetical protein
MSLLPAPVAVNRRPAFRPVAEGSIRRTTVTVRRQDKNGLRPWAPPLRVPNHLISRWSQSPGGDVSTKLTDKLPEKACAARHGT